MVIKEKQKEIIGKSNKFHSKCTLNIVTNINAGKVVCINNLEITLPSFSVMMFFLFRKYPRKIIDSAVRKTVLVWFIYFIVTNFRLSFSPSTFKLTIYVPAEN